MCGGAEARQVLARKSLKCDVTIDYNYINFDRVCLSIISLTQRWSVYTKNLRSLQLQRTVHFGLVARNRAANSFA